MDGSDTAIIVGSLTAIIMLIEVVKVLVTRRLNNNRNPGCKYNPELHASQFAQVQERHERIIHELEDIEQAIRQESELIRDWVNRRQK
jgi:flagellar biogenesis protein FliO